MRALSFVIYSPARSFDAALRSCQVVVRDRIEQLDQLVEQVAAQRPDALLVSLEQSPQAVFEALDKLLAPKPLLFFHGPDDSRLILQAMRAGAYEYVAPGPDEQEQLVAAIRRAAREAAGPAQVSQASLIAMIGVKGGVGASFVSCQLAAALASHGGRTALVDGQLRHGDIALYLDLAPRYDLASLAVRDQALDVTYLHSALVPHSSGVAVLAAPKHPEDADAVDASCIAGVIELLRAEFDWVLWDTPHDFDERSLRILEQSNRIVLITTPDVSALNHMRMQLELLARLGRQEDDVRVILNRSGSSAPLSTRDVKDFLKRPVDASIPNDYRRASACVNEGRTLHQVAPRSAIETAVSELAALAHGWCNRPLPTPRRRSLLDRLRGM
jgi:pilus assembly protein CpaE